MYTHTYNICCISELIQLLTVSSQSTCTDAVQPLQSARLQHVSYDHLQATIITYIQGTVALFTRPMRLLPSIKVPRLVLALLQHGTWQTWLLAMVQRKLNICLG